MSFCIVSCGSFWVVLGGSANFIRYVAAVGAMVHFMHLRPEDLQRRPDFFVSVAGSVFQ